MNLNYPNEIFSYNWSDFANIGSLREIYKETMKKYLPKDIRKWGLRKNEAIFCVYPVEFSVFNIQVIEIKQIQFNITEISWISNMYRA